jgi:cobaltochelatase CobN
VVLPEMDGRLVTAAISTKAESPRHDALEFTRLVHRPMPSRVAFVAALAAAWARLRRTPAAERRLAMVLSDYPGRAGRAAYAVGLDTWASVAAISVDLRAAGYAVAELPEDLAKKLTPPPSPASGRRGGRACSRRVSRAARRPARAARRRHHRSLGRPQ